jgi:hypothetical protein
VNKEPTVYLLRLSCVLGVTWKVVGHERGHGTFTLFNFPGAGYTQARYINPRGEIAGFYFDGAAFASPGHGFRRSKDGELTPIDFPGRLPP